eukprot:GFYU01018203.1.p1 GENE.GFYU01018203.1~~GFYU01018203.1.p1  ORF type:complete len:131 (+),score=13.94 GFYU01018203.1:3-395(+)
MPKLASTAPCMRSCLKREETCRSACDAPTPVEAVAPEPNDRCDAKCSSHAIGCMLRCTTPLCIAECVGDKRKCLSHCEVPSTIALMTPNQCYGDCADISIACVDRCDTAPCMTSCLGREDTCRAECDSQA